MKIRPHRSARTRYTLTLTLLFTLVLASRSEASCPGLNPLSSGWGKGEAVFYNVSSLPTTPVNLQTQAINALNAWTAANVQNGSGVVFNPADSQHPATLTFNSGQTQTGAPAETGPFNNVSAQNNTLVSTTITLNPNHQEFDTNADSIYTTLLKAFLHEIGHTMGMGDVPATTTGNPPPPCGGQTAGDSIMNGMCGRNDSAGNMPSYITNCDKLSTFNHYYTGPCPSPECNQGGSGSPADPCTYPGDAGGCGPGYENAGGCCNPIVPSPIVIDVDGSGFHLTSAAGGVWFDFYGNGHPIQIAWISATSTNGWLVLDRNLNGRIDSAMEMFGNVTNQPASSDRNGFLALTEFDKGAAGGNDDGKITSSDVMFSALRVWQDLNHNGISETNELHSLSEVGIATLECNYKASRRTDHYGNQFRYRAKVKDIHGAQTGRWAWDAFLVQAP